MNCLVALLLVIALEWAGRQKEAPQKRGFFFVIADSRSIHSMKACSADY
jgi:hypothetical protein